MSNNDVITFISHLIEYTVYRNEYKKSLYSKKRMIMKYTLFSIRE